MCVQHDQYAQGHSGMIHGLGQTPWWSGDSLTVQPPDRSSDTVEWTVGVNGSVLTVLTLKARLNICAKFEFGTNQYRMMMRLAVKDCAIMISFILWSWRGTGNTTSHYLRDCRRVRASQSAASVPTCVWIFSTAASRGIMDVLKWTPWCGSCGRLTTSSGSPESVRKSPCRAAKCLSRPGYADQRARERRTVFCGIWVCFFNIWEIICGLIVHL